MINNANYEFINGFLAGQMGKPVPPKASDEWLDAYGRGYETSERESAIAKYAEREIMK